MSFDATQSSIPARLQGSGVRSLGSLQVQRAFFDFRMGSDGPDLRPHAVALIEEPESHLHPHAVTALPSLLEREGVQTIASTHSSQLATVVSPESLMLLRINPRGAHVTADLKPAQTEVEATERIRSPAFFPEEMAKLKRLVERPFGELLFAQAMVIGDGATERAFLPLVIREALGVHGHAISVVDSNGMNADLINALVKFKSVTGIPLLVFSDGDTAGRESVNKLMSSDLIDVDDVIWVESESTDRPHTSIDSTGSTRGMAFEQMMVEFDLGVCQRACRAIDKHVSDRRSVLRELKKSKGAIGSILADEFIKSHPFAPSIDWPTPLKVLVTRLNETFDET